MSKDSKGKGKPKVFQGPTVSRRDRFKPKMGNQMDSESYGCSTGGRFRFNFRKWSDEDTAQYRKGYPGKKDHLNLKDNLLFYTGRLKSHPDGDLIDKIHENWWGDYRRLETHHGYIQWLFPIRESGMNFYSQELQLHEIKGIIADKKAHARVLKSYEMMLDFYGMVLDNKETGHIKRGEDWVSRFKHLNSSFHNYLRITRILKSLGEFDFEHLKKPFVEFVLQEALEEGNLRNVLESCVNYWIGTIKSDEDRKYLLDYVRKMEEGYGTSDPPTSSDKDDDDSAGTLGTESKPTLGEQTETRSFRGERRYDRFNSDDAREENEFSDDSHELEMCALGEDVENEKVNNVEENKLDEEENKSDENMEVEETDDKTSDSTVADKSDTGKAQSEQTVPKEEGVCDLGQV